MDLSLDRMIESGFDLADSAGSAESQFFAMFDDRQDAVRGESAIQQIRANVRFDTNKEHTMSEPMIAEIGDTPSDLDVAGNSRHDDLVESISAVYDLFDLTRFESLPEWKRVALAERAAPTVWNEARREDPDNTQLPWRVPNEAHVTQVWLTVDNDPSADRVWQYVTAAGNQVLMLVSDQSDGTGRYAEFGCIGTLTARDDEDAADTIRLIRQMVGNVRRLGLAEFDDLDVDATEGDRGLAEFGDL